MANVHFYLKKPEKSTGESLIFLQWKYNGRILRYSFGQTINPSKWSYAKERAKEKHTTVKGDDKTLNSLLDTLSDICKETYDKLIGKGIPKVEDIKEQLVNYVEQKSSKKSTPTFLELL